MVFNYSRWHFAGKKEPGRQPPKILEHQSTLSQPRGSDYAHHITTLPLGFSDLPTAPDQCGTPPKQIHKTPSHPGRVLCSVHQRGFQFGQNENNFCLLDSILALVLEFAINALASFIF